MNQPRELDTTLVEALHTLLGERITTSRGIRDHHGRDESSYPAAAPDAVVFPHSTEEVRDIVNICRLHKTPVVPYGVGSSLEGHTLAIHGGVCIDLSQMNQILAIREADLDCTVQAGVTRKQLNEHIRHSGLMFPLDPGADATLGGMAATRASGTNAVRYGTMRENVIALTVVLADGRIIRTARRSRKSSAGYDLTRMFVGSEGTLGVITEVTLRLYAIPEAMSAATCSFKDIGGAVDTVIQTLQSGIPIARSEALCGTTMRAINAYSKTNYPEQPMLFLEFHGTHAGVEEQAQLVQEIAHANGGMEFQWATRAEDRNKLWQARHDAYFSCLQLRHGTRSVSTDVCVPISRLTECIVETTKDIDKASMPIPLFGHVGDGNFHCVILVRTDSEADLAEARTFNERLVNRALDMEGTCTGEIGVGIGKMKWMHKEHGEALDLMRAIKHAFDPEDLMNPGKILPRSDMNGLGEPAPALLEDLRALLGERITASRGVREHHGKDESYYPYAPPDAVAFPHSTEEVRDIVNICRLHKTPIIPFGVGTSLEGHVLAIHGGVCIDLSQMNKILAVREADLDATVQAGVTRKQLNEHIRHSGLMFPIDPGADATLGGMAATRASGTNAVRYGTMRENVIALTVVLADGRIIRTARRSRKSSAGYDLTRMFIGSEGTLGIITEVTVRLYAIPEAMSAAVCSFKDIAGAVDTVIQTLQSGIPIARSEALCATTMRAINAYSKTGYREQPTLFLEFHGTRASVEEQAQLVQEIAHANGGMEFQWATRAEDRNKLWQARHDAYFACLQLRAGTRCVSTDVCVPISRLTECIIETAKDIDKASMPIPLFGHVGDGNFHCVVLVRADNEADLAEARAFNERLVNRALDMEGTCTGEHGVGFGKMKWLAKEHGEALDLMRAIKRAFDPENLMNPGKVVSLQDSD